MRFLNTDDRPSCPHCSCKYRDSRGSLTPNQLTGRAGSFVLSLLRISRWKCGFCKGIFYLRGRRWVDRQSAFDVGDSVYLPFLPEQFRVVRVNEETRFVTIARRDDQYFELTVPLSRIRRQPPPTANFHRVS